MSMISTGYRKRVTLLLFALLLVRFWLGRTFELTGQEAVVWMEGKHLAWGYWDRGPLMPFLSYLGTVFFGQTELGVRWLASAITAASGFLLFYTTRQWFGPRAGFYAVLLFAVVPLFAWQMLLLSEETASVGLMALALLCYRQASERGKWYDWLGAGAVSGFAVTVSWWNILWPAGLLFFRLIDPQRREAWFDRRVALLIALSLLGFLPFLMWYQKMGLFPAVGRSAVHWLAAKQHAAGYGTGALVFLRNQAVWLGVGCFAALVFLLGRARDYAFLRRSQLFLLSLCVPGLLVQFLMSFLGRENPDVLAALYLPTLALAGSVGTRVADADRRWRLAGLAVIVLAGAQTVTGLVPWTARHFWGDYSPNRFERNRALAVEVARTERESGASFLIVDNPVRAALLSFYLPLQPFVYVPPDEGVRNQFDLWPGYRDFEPTNALFITRAAEPSSEIVREFAQVRPLPPIPIPEAQAWKLFFCERYAAATHPGEAP